MSLENKITDGLKPISQNAEQSKVEMLACEHLTSSIS